MAGIGNTNLTLLDLAKQMDPDGSSAAIIDLLTQRNPILQDATAFEGNLTTGHRFTTSSSLPAIAWARFNEGVAVSKGTNAQHDEVCGRLKGFSEVDADLLQLARNPAAARAGEDKKFVSAFNNEVTRALIYASVAAAPEQIHGIMPRYDLTTRYTGGQIISHTASPSGADQASILFITWGDDYTSLIYPKGTMAGMKTEDHGKYVVTDSSGRKLTVYGTEFTWWLGLCVKDYRQNVRIANIDTSALATTGTDLIEKMIDAYFQIFDPSSGRTAIYVPRTIAAFLHKQALNKTNVALTIGELFGKPVTMFMGMPIRMVDAMLTTEAIVS